MLSGAIASDSVNIERHQLCLGCIVKLSRTMRDKYLIKKPEIIISCDSKNNRLLVIAYASGSQVKAYLKFHTTKFLASYITKLVCTMDDTQLEKDLNSIC